MHLNISSKQKEFYDGVCREVDNFFIKIFQDYKVAYQKAFWSHPEGLAYRIVETQANYFTQVR